MSNEATEVMGTDAQMGIVRVLRPYSTFADVYDGETVAGNLIALTEDGNPLDPLAGQTGYDERLVRGLSVPLGAKCLLWLPNLVARDGVDRIPYIYSLYWRMRNAYDFRQQFRTPYHYPKQGAGVPETLVDAGPRVVIPAAMPSVTYVQAEPAVGLTATQNMLHENFRQQGTATAGNIINPDGSVGAIQQGIETPSLLSAHLRPTFTAVETICAGDELIVVVNRETNAGSVLTWDFSVVDGAFASMFSGDYPDIGVYVLVGSGTP